MCNIGAIILAAGTSSRMGRPKLLLPYKGLPIVAYPLLLACRHNLHPIVCVTGRYDLPVQEVLQSWREDVTFQLNPHYKNGMSSSLKKGIDAVKGKVDAVLIFLGDQPLVPDEVIQSIVENYKAYKEKGIKIIRPFYNGQMGHPILFDSSLFNAFDDLQGDEGGKAIIQQNAKSLKLLHFPNTDWGIDVDTPEDYSTLMKKE